MGATAVWVLNSSFSNVTAQSDGGAVYGVLYLRAENSSFTDGTAFRARPRCFCPP